VIVEQVRILCALIHHYEIVSCLIGWLVGRLVSLSGHKTFRRWYVRSWGGDCSSHV